MPTIEAILKPLICHPALEAICKAAEVRRSVSLSGLTRPAKAVAAAALAHRFQRPVVLITHDNESADRMFETAAAVLRWLEPEGKNAAGVLPAFDTSPYDGRSPHPEIMERRAIALWSVALGKTRLLFVPVAAALGRFRENAYYRSLALELKPGDELVIDDLTAHLATAGYEPAEPVSEAGQFSVRGGIVDIFPPKAAWPVRLEFFGDSIESLREFDPASQRSRKTVTEALILPLAETARSSDFFERLVRALAERGRSTRRPEAEPAWSGAYSNPFPGWEFYAPLAEPRPHTLFSLFGNPLVLWDELIERRQQLQEIFVDLAARFEEVRDVEPPPPTPEDVFLTQAEIAKALEPLAQIEFKELGMAEPGIPSASSGDGRARNDYALPSQPAPKFRASIKGLADDLRGRLVQGGSVILVAPTTGTAERLVEICSEYHIPFETGVVIDPRKDKSLRPHSAQPRAADGPGLPRDGGLPAESSQALKAGSAAVLILPGGVDTGVTFPDLGLLILSDRDVFGDFVWGATRRKEKAAAASFLSDLSDLKVHDYVVHIDHGIGQYRGLKQLTVEGREHDFMLLTYQDEARLYVPLERLDLVEKYRASGDGAPKPRLDRLGGTSWQRTKKTVRRALRDMAEELLKLYAERKTRGGTAFSADSEWQREFEDSFPFQETPDQLSALTDIKRDLESPGPMDRLLCGDVGYGKTELAMRAAFKAAQDAKQVVVLAPTTVLAFQHYNTFRERMAAFPIHIEMLSRFRSATEQERILADTAAGRIDILIGTHRLLSKDVRFHDLGLLIVDEEQRFGVAAKERLKSLRAGVDALTMSATPIPRTLHMALGGLRDLSVIESPPQGRLAIQTVVAPFNDSLIQSAVLREMEREGQIYFVHNRVQSIFPVAAILQKLVPKARIGVAHGQIGERELERVMLKFMEGKYDLLVATALIENGLDIPRANTMIINHAERFGLADLYQLRGRVGRSDRPAYAYLLIPAEDALTPIARRRLAALKEFSDLGAGFRLAALDLELRGAGNVLGAEQHGHLNAIGIDLYLKMLEEAVRELKGQPAQPEVRATLNLGLDIKIPEAYITDERQRLKMYKRISALATPEAAAELEAELTDRYGPVPEPVRTLLQYALVKTRAEQLRIETIERKGEEIRLRFHDQTPVSPERLTRLLGSRSGATFTPDGILRLPLRRQEASDILGHVQNVLRGLQA
jgi:transcription-repair coupling factor (superfamily II helicase)